MQRERTENPRRRGSHELEPEPSRVGRHPPTASNRNRKEGTKLVVVHEEEDDDSHKEHAFVGHDLQMDDAFDNDDGNGDDDDRDRDVHNGDTDASETEEKDDEEEHELDHEEDDDGGRTKKKQMDPELKQLQRRLKKIDPDDKYMSSFPGGPMNLYVLRNYGIYISGWVWRHYLDEVVSDRDVLMVYNHERRMSHDVSGGDDYTKHVLHNYGLAPLVGCCYFVADMERRHLSITLDNVMCLLHIPIRGNFFSLPELYHLSACELLGEQLNVTESTKNSKGRSVTFTWLEKVINPMHKRGDHVAAAKAYMLRFLGIA